MSLCVDSRAASEGSSGPATEVPLGTLRGNDVPIGKATISYLTLVGFLFLSACERAPRERRLPVPDLRGGEPSIELDPDAPLDPRVIPLVPDGLVGTDRLCDLSFVGEPAPSRGAHQLPEG